MIRLNPSNFLLPEIPLYHPLSAEYIRFWKEQKKRCIEGFWHDGYYLPSSLYFYINFGTILRNTTKSKNIKTVEKPLLRDLEWMIFREWVIARGFSGFELDDQYSANSLILSPLATPELLLQTDPTTVYYEDGVLKVKEFRSPRTLLEMQHPYHKGRALYENEAFNMLMLGSRDSGKSYGVGVGIVLPTWIFNGLTDSKTSITDQSILLTVGAEDSKYSSLLLNKTKFALEHIPGDTTSQGRKYPSPFSVQYSGSWASGSGITAAYAVKTKGGWDKKGTRATINHRTFKDNPFADQGSRPLAIIVEEAGHASSLRDLVKNTKDNLRDGTRKTGTLLMLGTSGDMGRGTEPAFEMFYEPEAYDILPTLDTYESRGNIGFFIPAYTALNNFKDEWGYTKKEEAIAALQEARNKASKGSSDALNKEIQYRPIVPSEMFLSKEATIFPAVEIRKRLTELISNPPNVTYVNLFFDPTSKTNVSYEIDLHATPIDTHPWNKDNTEGAIAIYEFPVEINGEIAKDTYIIGHDPYRDNTGSTGSFASIYVLKTSKYPAIGFEEVVASYIGRPYDGVGKVNEILYKLSLFYGNATIYFENAVGNTKDYFEKVKRLDLLAKQPVNILNKKASYNIRDTHIYGYPMSNERVKWEALQYVRTFLLEQRDPTTKNLDVINDKFLLQQLSSFNLKGNFDAVMGFVGCVLGLNEMTITSKRREEMAKPDDEFIRIFVKNKNLFREQLSDSKTIL